MRKTDKDLIKTIVVFMGLTLTLATVAHYGRSIPPKSAGTQTKIGITVHSDASSIVGSLTDAHVP